MGRRGEKQQYSPLAQLMMKVVNDFQIELFPDSYAGSRVVNHKTAMHHDSETGDRHTFDATFERPGGKITHAVEIKTTKSGFIRTVSPSDVSGSGAKRNVAFRYRQVDASMGADGREKGDPKEQFDRLLQHRATSSGMLLVDEEGSKQVYGVQFQNAYHMARGAQLLKDKAGNLKVKQDASMFAGSFVYRMLQAETRMGVIKQGALHSIQPMQGKFAMAAGEKPTVATGTNVLALLDRAEKMNKGIANKQAQMRVFPTFAEIAQERGLFVASVNGLSIIGGGGKTAAEGIRNFKRQLYASPQVKEAVQRGVEADRARKKTGMSWDRERRMLAKTPDKGSPWDDGVRFSDEAGKEDVPVLILARPASVPELVEGMRVNIRGGSLTARVTFGNKPVSKRRESAQIESTGNRVVRVKASKGKKAYVRSKAKRK